MASEEELIQRAEAITGDKITAAGVFSIQDNYKAIAAGGLATSFLPGSGNPAEAGLLAGATIETAREATAAKEGVTVTMLVAVTDKFIHILSLSGLSAEPHEELMRFDRATTKITIKKFGFSRKIHLQDENGQELGLMGAPVNWTSSGKADKSVLEELAHSVSE